MGWRLWKRVRNRGRCKGRQERGGSTPRVIGCFRPSQQEEEEEQKEERELEHLNLEEGRPIDCKEEEAIQEQDKEQGVKFLRMRWVPVKQRRRLHFVRCLCCCLRSTQDDEEEEDEEEYFKKLSHVWSRRKSDSDCILVGEKKEADSNKEKHVGDQIRSQEYKREAVCSLASYVKNTALKLHQEKSQLRRQHHELQNIEEICKQLVQFIVEDRGAHWKDYESLFLLFMVMVKPLFHRVLQYEECPIIMKVIEKLREYIDEIILCARRIIGFFSNGERETLEYFMKTSKEWLSHFEGDYESSTTDDVYLPDDEDIHLKYTYLTRRLRKNQTGDIREKILGKSTDERKHKNIEESHTSIGSQVKLAEHPFKHVIPHFTKPQHPSTPKGQFMEFHHGAKAFSETPQMLYMLQTIMIYIIDTQKKVQIEETRILRLHDEFENIEEALIQVMDFICEDQGASMAQVYENKLLEIRKVTQPMFYHVIQQEEWPKMMRMLRLIKSLCYRMVFRIQQWHFLNIFSQEMIGRMKTLLDDMSDWMVDVSDKISAFETCERIEESQRFNNLLPDNEVLYSRIIRRIQKLKDNDNDDLDVWMSCLYHRDLGFARPVISMVPNDNELSSDDESSCEGVASWWKSVGVGAAAEACQPMASASLDSQTISALRCYNHPVSSGDLQVSDPSAAGSEETGSNKKNTGQGDVYVTEKMEAKPAEKPISNIILEISNSKQCQRPLDMTILMWICALLYFWKHMLEFD